MSHHRRLRPERSPQYIPQTQPFRKGTAVAAHQTEGNNTNNDWWKYEQTLAPAYESSGNACNSYELFKKDREALQLIGANSYRISLEWSRIEPSPGVFSDEALSHYEEVIDDLRAHDIEPIITIHHFTNPVWMENLGGWENPASSEWFRRYASQVVPRLNGRIHYWLTLNEPNVMVQQKYAAGIWHPHKKSFVHPYFKVYPNLIKAHKNAYGIIKNHNPGAQVSIASNFASLRPEKNIYYPVNAYYNYMYNRFSNHYMYNKLKDYLDFIGLNFYTRANFTLSPLDLFRGKPHIRLNPKPPEGPNDLEFDAHPEDISPVVKHLVTKYRKPVMITENGYVTNDDQGRVEYLRGMNEELIKLRHELGGNFLGYMLWTLIDNYEWNLGFGAEFGIFSVDRTNPEFPRTPKPSASVYRDSIKEHRGLDRILLR